MEKAFLQGLAGIFENWQLDACVHADFERVTFFEPAQCLRLIGTPPSPPVLVTLSFMSVHQIVVEFF